MKKTLDEVAEKLLKYADDFKHFDYVKINALFYVTIFFLTTSMISYVFGYNIVTFFSLLFSIVSLLLLVIFTHRPPSEADSLNSRRALTREFVEILKKEKQELQKEVQELRNENKALKNEFVLLREQVKQKQEDIVGLRNEYSELQLKYASDLKKQSQRQMEAFRKNIDKKSQMLNEKIDQLLHNPIINQPSLSYTPQIQQDNIIEIEEEDEEERILRLIEERENEGF